MDAAVFADHAQAQTAVVCAIFDDVVFYQVVDDRVYPPVPAADRWSHDECSSTGNDEWHEREELWSHRSVRRRSINLTANCEPLEA
mmetsp:Transcript_21089/g.55014  ORF Transcript_21089/g.55014 Transcript_21089/m.55014 type:complete len:86 (-) Transcript_21089:32-289(-)